MNNKTMSKRLMSLVLAAGTAGLLVGCKSANYKQADKTGSGIADFRTEILNGKKAIDATMASLGQIEASAATDPRKSYEQ